jgi:hypothetical protein
MDAAAQLLRGEGLKIEMKRKLLGLGLGLTLSTLGVAAAAVPATAAFADTTCYTGCTTAITSPPTTAPTPQVAPTVVTTPAPTPTEPPVVKAAASSLPFTGADIEEMAAVGAGALLVGGLLVRRSRRVRRAAA